ncbi:hypothetical protein HWV62_43513 [Athelia sp. TMB]|nr:hypothetical protein HWV62_43513 [Athelia sp. TMB]
MRPSMRSVLLLVLVTASHAIADDSHGSLHPTSTDDGHGQDPSVTSRDSGNYIQPKSKSYVTLHLSPLLPIPSALYHLLFYLPLIFTHALEINSIHLKLSSPAVLHLHAGAIAGIVLGLIAVLFGALAIIYFLKRAPNNPTKPASPARSPSYTPEPAHADLERGDDDGLPGYAAAQRGRSAETAQVPGPASSTPSLHPGPYPPTAFPAQSSASLHASRRARSGTVQSAEQGRRVAGGPNTRVGVRPGTAASQVSLLSDASHAHPRSRAPILDAADRAFVERLPALDLPAPEIARIVALLALGGGHALPSEKPLPETLLASIPDVGAADVWVLQRLWACDVGVAELSRVVEVLREQAGTQAGVVGAGIAAPPGYVP